LWSNLKRVPLNNNPPVPGHASLPKDADSADPRSYDVFKGQDYAPDRINEQALAFLRKNRDKPFFLYYPTVIPHVALHVPDEELEPYLAQKWDDPPFTRAKGYGYTPHFTPRAAYAAMISRMDRYIGRLLGLVNELGLAENTIVVFTSDNGTTHLKAEVERREFELLIEGMVDSTLTCLDRALEDAGMAMGDLDQVLFAGG
ncbi:MAG: sulfatase-like hydrolase/transferase, partial [Verrucomicrobiota bacterium]|nr:sulfatase-like hydrolase/transferase [Verrucomicrobiota bacterium]